MTVTEDYESYFLNSFLEDLSHQRVNLPSLPEVAVRVRRVVDDPDATAQRVAKAVNVDPALSSRLLKVVNSVLYRGTYTIDTVQGAVARLGMEQVRRVVTALAVEQLCRGRHSPVVKARLKGLWQHSTRVAALSFVLARRFTRVDAEQAMLAGLLHDIGALPVLSQAEQFPNLLASAEDLDDLVTRLHTVVGPFILRSWGFGQEMVAVVECHEDLCSEREGAVGYVDVVTVANLHSHLGRDHRLARLDWSGLPVFRRLALTPQMSIQAMEEARDELLALQQALAG